MADYYSYPFTGPQARYSLLGDRAYKGPVIPLALSPGGEHAEAAARKRTQRWRQRVQSAKPKIPIDSHPAGE